MLPKKILEKSEMTIYFDHDKDERLKHADEDLDELLEKWQVDICVDNNGDYFFDVREPVKLRVV